ncbi:TIGR03668 family PPOX class F420-dependent oxidoreductase [Thermogemmatispora sp.]|uniref:TIGR03668 family PPOX class F420-dependent oxidoreductase n=1 Tax=Thermogemmatispora sp. TaxID=1968838 RepID=UPI001DDF6818|nr:TIGR03668 family PPOX class F420-dependent oxidoreductase [Thermogemmatispora sp.]MBX5450049.1 TIGR03668 family PPOX class F420-dependent oxidoreductase [Thermogemmatispora sp.]
MSKRAVLTEEERRFVLGQRVARLATADAEGHPHLVPVCYAFDGMCFYTPLDEKPKRVAVTALRRVRNIEARPEAALLIDHYEDDWSRLGYVLIEGEALLLYPGDERQQRAVALLRARYPQYQRMTLEQLPVIMLTPRAVTSWGPALAQASDVSASKIG